MYHKIVIAGRLGRDPEMRYTPDGKPVTSLSVAASQVHKEGNSFVRETLWFRVSVFGASAENCNRFLKKGSSVLIEGRLLPGENGGPRVWKDKEGEPHANFEVLADRVIFMTHPQSQSVVVNENAKDDDNFIF